MSRILIAFIFLCAAINSFAQPFNPPPGIFFNDEVVPRIDILIAPENLDFILEEGNEESDEEFPATFIFNDGTNIDTLFNVGFRLRGNTSRVANKKSFKIAINSFVGGRTYKGLEKINLNGSHNDPSSARVKFAWKLATAMGIPASRSNHVLLYINNSNFGVYSNVEHIDEKFIEKRFGNNSGNLYKCLWPADLNYLGAAISNYQIAPWGRRMYDLKTNTHRDDYSDIAFFINVLNNSSLNELSCELEQIFNVDAYLKAVAFEILIGHWDNMIYNKNNFYLYFNNESQRFEYLPYDLDNTLGLNWVANDHSFANRNIYEWENQNEYRPAYERILQIPIFRDRLSYYIEEAISTNLTLGSYEQELMATQALLANYISNDPYYPLDYGYSFNDYSNSFVSPSSSFWYIPHSILSFIEERSVSAVNQLENYSLLPILNNLKANQAAAEELIPISIYAESNSDLESIRLHYQVDNQAWEIKEMLDDGINADGLAGDNYYTAEVRALPSGSLLKYWTEARAVSGESARLPACDTESLRIGKDPNLTLSINEVMTSNQFTIQDETGEYADWIELHNYGNQNIGLQGKYLTDNLDLPTKWPLPNVIMGPGEYFIFWADNDDKAGQYHCNFRLDKAGERIAIFNSKNAAYNLIDEVDIGEIATDNTWGRIPNGTGEWTVLNPSPRISNENGAVVFGSEETLILYPNPVQDQIKLFKRSISGSFELQIIDVKGKLIYSEVLDLDDTLNHEISVNHLMSGVYFIKLKSDGQSIPSNKFIKL